MKKPRMVEIPDDRLLDFKTYMDFNDHAYNSALFYATSYNKNSYQIREKLLAKGYVEDDVIMVKKSGEKEVHNIIDETITRLEEAYILDDEEYVREFIESGLNSGKSLQSLKTKLLTKQVPSDIISRVVEKEFDDADDSYGLNKKALTVVRSTSFTRLDMWKKKQKFIRTLSGQGFSPSDIYSWIDENEEYFE